LIAELNDLEPPESEVVRLSESLGDILFRCLELDFDFTDIPMLKRR